MSLKRLSVIGAAAAVLVTGCGSSHANSTSPTTRSTSTSTSTPSTTAVTVAPIDTKTVAVTDSSGYRYVLSATPITAAASQRSYQGNTLDTPPGQDYLTTTVTIRSGVTDRSEPDIGFTDNGTGPFVMAVPASTASASGQGTFCDDTSTTTLCMMSGITGLGQETPSPSDPISPQLAPGSSTTVVVYVGPLPSSVSASSASLYFAGGSGAAVPIPNS